MVTDSPVKRKVQTLPCGTLVVMSFFYGSNSQQFFPWLHLDMGVTKLMTLLVEIDNIYIYMLEIQGFAQ